MRKYLVKVVFEYFTIPSDGVSHTGNTVFLGMFEEYDDAVKKGNSFLEHLENKFPESKPRSLDLKRLGKQKLKSNIGVITSKKYSNLPFSFYIRILPIDFESDISKFDKKFEEMIKINKSFEEYKKGFRPI